MVIANSAYDSGDIDCLAQIHSDLSVAAENTQTPEGIRLAHLTTYLTQIQRQLAEVEASILKIESSDIFQIKKRVEEAEKEGTDLLVEMAHDIQTEIIQAKEYLRQLMGEPEAGRRNVR